MSSGVPTQNAPQPVPKKALPPLILNTVVAARSPIRLAQCGTARVAVDAAAVASLPDAGHRGKMGYVIKLNFHAASTAGLLNELTTHDKKNRYSYYHPTPVCSISCPWGDERLGLTDAQL